MSKWNEREDWRGRRGGGTVPGDPNADATADGPRELVIVAHPEAGLRVVEGAVASVTGADVASLSATIAEEGIVITPLFGLSEDRLRLRTAAAEDAAATAGTRLPDLSVFYGVEAPDERLEEIAERLRGHDTVEAAFIKPAPEPPQTINDMAPSPEPAPPVTANFTSRQGYLAAAPGGVDARFAWALGGGLGAGVRIIDIEGAWRFSHEDLLQNQGGVVDGVQRTEAVWRNHGTAVIGVFSGDRTSFGVTGICPEANVRAISAFDSQRKSRSAKAIRQAADMLGPGDIVLIELHRPGPRLNFEVRSDQRGYIAIEWWPDDLAAIQYAVSRGIIVVEAGGNGAENLDAAIYDVNPPAPKGPFPATWRNPFRRGSVDSGAIVVGAGAPPPGTHGNDHGADRSRLDFSNHGAMFDAQGWGREVTTCGYGDLQGGTNEDLWYTDEFSGTSSASPIVVGSLGCVQGVLRAAGRPLLTPRAARDLLRAMGTAQQDGPNGPSSQRIGNRPDVRQMINSLLPSPPAVGAGEAVEPDAGESSADVVININGKVTINISG
jgi:hypothetical protein